jgi:hypothetical protein
VREQIGGPTAACATGVCTYFTQLANDIRGATAEAEAQTFKDSGANVLLQGSVASESVIFNFVTNLAHHTFKLGGKYKWYVFIIRTHINHRRWSNVKQFETFSTESIVANVQDVRFPKITGPQVLIAKP